MSGLRLWSLRLVLAKNPGALAIENNQGQELQFHRLSGDSQLQVLLEVTTLQNAELDPYGGHSRVKIDDKEIYL